MGRVGAASVATLAQNIEAYEERKGEMESEHMDRWVIFYDGDYIDDFDDFQDAAMLAIRKWGCGPYLIRLVGELEAVIPTAVLPGPAHGAS